MRKIMTYIFSHELLYFNLNKIKDINKKSNQFCGKWSSQSQYYKILAVSFY